MNLKLFNEISEVITLEQLNFKLFHLIQMGFLIAFISRICTQTCAHWEGTTISLII